jgi:hypothetical protein
VINRRKLHLKGIKGIDVTAEPHEQFGGGHEWIGKITRKNVVPQCAPWRLDVARPNAWGRLLGGTRACVGDLTNLAVASTATQADITATVRVGTAFLSHPQHTLYRHHRIVESVSLATKI